MRKWNNKGVAEVAILYGIIIVLGLLFVPNPVSQATGIGVKPNKTVQKENTYEKVELLKDEKGNPVLADNGAFLATRVGGSYSSDIDKQQHTTLWQSFIALPRLFLILVILAIFGFPPAVFVITKLKSTVTSWLNKYNDLKTESKRIVLSVDEGLQVIDAQIQSANSMVNTSMQLAANTADPVVLARHQETVAIYRAVAKALNDTKTDFLKALSNKQDGSTKLLVKSLQQPS